MRCLKKVAKVIGHSQVGDGGELFLSGFLERINVELEVVFEESAKRLQNSALKLGVVFFVEQFS